MFNFCVFLLQCALAFFIVSGRREKKCGRSCNVIFCRLIKLRLTVSRFCQWVRQTATWHEKCPSISTNFTLNITFSKTQKRFSISLCTVFTNESNLRTFQRNTSLEHEHQLTVLLKACLTFFYNSLIHFFNKIHTAKLNMIFLLYIFVIRPT